jgi:hypothetical protein
MSSLQPLPLTGQACWVRNELCFWWNCQFQLALGVSKAVAAELPHHHIGFFSNMFCPSPSSRQKGSIPSVCLATSFVQRGCNRVPSCARIWSFPRLPGGLADSLGWKWISYKANQAGGRERFCVHMFLVGSSLPKCFQQLILWFSVLHYCWWDCRHTKAKRGSVSTHITAGPGTPRCFQVSAVLCRSAGYLTLLPAVLSR